MSEENAVVPYIYIVTSCKGGIGKSTVSANLAYALAMHQKRVLCVDCDYSNRSLDLIFGCENRIKTGIEDLLDGTATVEETVIDVNGKGLYFIPGPTKALRFDAETFRRIIVDAAVKNNCDTIIVDTPGASDGLLSVISHIADCGIVVASHMPTAVRGAEKTGELLLSLGMEKRYLIINRFDADKVLKGERMGINELIDSTCLMLLGVIPDSEYIELGQENGVLAADLKKDRKKCAAAFDEIAARLCGSKVPILSFVSAFRRRRLIDPRRKMKTN